MATETIGDVVVRAPGRVNLIGDHVDYIGGVVLPMAIDLGTTMAVGPADEVLVASNLEPGRPVRIGLDGEVHGSMPAWGRYVRAAIAELDDPQPFAGVIASDLPIGAGLSSSSSLTVAVLLAAGAELDPVDLARRARRAETAATGVPCGIMDQLTITAAVAGSALRIDCRDETYEPVALPRHTAVWVAHSGVARTLEGSAYTERREACEAAEREIGPLRGAAIDDAAGITDPAIRTRARHVITEIARVEAAVSACRRDDAAALGRLMVESHLSLRDDYEVSIPELDALVEALCAVPGVHGARLTGAGFGGCAVAVADTSVTELPAELGARRMVPSDGASIRTRR